MKRQGAPLHAPSDDDRKWSTTGLTHGASVGTSPVVSRLSDVSRSSAGMSLGLRTSSRKPGKAEVDCARKSASTLHVSETHKERQP